MQAVILAGGISARLHGLSTDLPKPLTPFFDRPLVHHIVKLLAKHEIRDIIVALSPKAKGLIEYLGSGASYGVQISYSIENEPLGTAGAVKLLQPKLSDSFLVISGDLITDLDLNAAVRAHKTSRAMATLLLHEVDDPSQFGMVECDDNSRITRLIEKPRSTETSSNTVSTGIYVLEPEALSSIAYNTDQDFATNLFPRMLNNQEKVCGFQTTGYWCDAGNPLHYRGAHFDALQGKLSVEIPAVHVGEGIWVSGGVDIDPSAELSSPIYIGSGASVRRDARIGRGTIIGANAIVDEGASVARSVIGAGAHIGRDTIVTDSLVWGGYLVTQGKEEAPVTIPTRQTAPAGGSSAETAFARETLA